VAQLSAAERARLPDTAFAYVDSHGKRRLPVHDASHVRNALARFGQVAFESEHARQQARRRLLAAAKKHGIVPLGFIDSQLRTDQSHAAAGRVVIEAATIRTPKELAVQLRRALDDPGLAVLTWNQGDWLDIAGDPVELPAGATVLESRGEPAAALVTGSALSDPDLADAVLAAVRLVVERHRLDTEPSGLRLDPSRLPTGPVTLLFTDIEGSTELLTQITDRYAHVLKRVRTTIRREVRRHGGHQIDATGDETFSVFAEASQAALAAAEIQRDLVGRRWPEGVGVRLRMGLHSGEPTPSEEGYVGLAVNTAARVMGAAHGGQILLTRATADALEKTIGLGLRTLGEYRLKGLSGSFELLQVTGEGLLDEAPPPRVPRSR
jgi:class 3 adenylate cyclase